MKYYETFAWDQNTKLDPKSEPNMVYLANSFSMDEVLFCLFFFTILIEKLTRETLYHISSHYVCIPFLEI
jgi:hypothetical protein